MIRPPLVLTGPPGAGKSTVAAVLVAGWSPSALVGGDAFFAFLREGAVDPWLPASHQQNETVVEAAAAATGRLARGGISVVHEGVIGPWFVSAFLAATGLDTVHYAVLLPPLDVCLDRVRTRRGHGFTDLHAARHLYEQFAPPGSPLDPRHLVAVRGDEEPADVARRVRACVDDGSLLIG